MHRIMNTIVSIKKIIPAVKTVFEGKNLLYIKIVDVKIVPQTGRDGTVILFKINLNSSNFKNKPHTTAVR